MLSFRSTTICAIVLVAVISLVHEFASSKQLSQLLKSTLRVEGSAFIRFQDRDGGDGDEGNPYPLDHFCVEWSETDARNRTIQPIDEWWTHHVEFDIVSENDTHQCFEREFGSAKSVMLLRLYRNQFHTSCEKVHKRYQWSSGWGADFKNVLGGLEEALDKHHVPFVMSWNPLFPKRWHYAANKIDGSNKTCPEQDLSCYFVPYHPCGKDNEVTNNTVGKADGGAIDFPNHPKGLRVYQYVTRPLLWLRRSIFNYIEQQNLGLTRGQCSIIHVRRADVVLHGRESRKYFPVKDYVDLLPPDVQQNHEILLLTDDQNAIEEAHEFFPWIKWRYLDRPRHNGTSGGWENQTPSRNPAGEVTTILSTFEMAKNCVHLVHGEGSFSELVWAYMKMQSNHAIYKHRVDQGATFSDRFNSNNRNSPEQLRIQLEELRKTQQGGSADVEQQQQQELAREEAQPETAALKHPPNEEPQPEQQPNGMAQPGAEPDHPSEDETRSKGKMDLSKRSMEKSKQSLDDVPRQKEQGQRHRRLGVEEEMWPLGPTFETELGR